MAKAKSLLERHRLETQTNKVVQEPQPTNPVNKKYSRADYLYWTVFFFILILIIILVIFSIVKGIPITILKG